MLDVTNPAPEQKEKRKELKRVIVNGRATFRYENPTCWAEELFNDDDDYIDLHMYDGWTDEQIALDVLSWPYTYKNSKGASAKNASPDTPKQDPSAQSSSCLSGVNTLGTSNDCYSPSAKSVLKDPSGLALDSLGGPMLPPKVEDPPEQDERYSSQQLDSYGGPMLPPKVEDPPEPDERHSSQQLDSYGGPMLPAKVEDPPEQDECYSGQQLDSYGGPMLPPKVENPPEQDECYSGQQLDSYGGPMLPPKAEDPPEQDERYSAPLSPGEPKPTEFRSEVYSPRENAADFKYLNGSPKPPVSPSVASGSLPSSSNPPMTASHELVDSPTAVQPMESALPKAKRRSTFPEDCDKDSTKSCHAPKSLGSTPVKPASPPAAPRYLETGADQILRERAQSNPYSDPSYKGAKALQLHYNVNIYPSPSLWKSEVFNALNREAAGEVTAEENAAAFQEAKNKDPSAVLGDPKSSDLDQHFLNNVVSVPGFWCSDILKNKPITRHPKYEVTQYEPALKRHAELLQGVMIFNKAGVYKESGYSLKAEAMRADQISRENFNLSFQLYNLKEKLKRTQSYYKHDLAKENLLLRVQTQEALRECRRHRDLLRDARKTIFKMEMSEKARLAMVTCNRTEPMFDVERQAQYHFEAAQNYHLVFEDIQRTIVSQDEEIAALKKLLKKPQVSAPPNQAEMEELRRANLALKAENERLVADNNQVHHQLQEQTARHERLQHSSNEGENELADLRLLVAELQGENESLSNSNHQLSLDIQDCEEEIDILRDQVAELQESSPNQEGVMHTDLLIGSLRDQLATLNHRLEQDKHSLLREQTHDNPGPCVECTIRKNPAKPGETPLSELVARITRGHKATDPDASALCNGIYYMEVYFSALVEKLKYAMVVEDIDSRNRLMKEEISRLESVCHSGIFPSASLLLSTQDKFEMQSDKLAELESVLKMHEEYAQKKDDYSSSVNARDELLLALLKDLSNLVPVSGICDPAVDFEAFQATIKDAISAVAHLFNVKVTANVNQIHDEINANTKDLEERLAVKTHDLLVATEKVISLNGRYGELKTKAMILKKRLSKAKDCNDALLLKIKNLGGSSSGPESF